jgi:hypothetical protein
MSEKPFDPRAIPYREHYDRLMTFANPRPPITPPRGGHAREGRK